MVVAVRTNSPTKGKPPKLSMLELVTLVNNRYKKTKLRRKVLPKAYCYVCSKVDPSGIFRHPNSYLYQKGFFHVCEHFPKAPYSTFVEEAEPGAREVTTTKPETEYSKDGAPSFSVTIHQGSSVSRSVIGSEVRPLKSQKTVESVEAGGLTNLGHAISRSTEKSDNENLGAKKETADVKTGHGDKRDRQQTLSVPSTSFGRPEISRSSKRSEKSAYTFQRLGGKQSRFSKPETYVTSVSEHVSGHPKPLSRVTIIPTGLNDDGSSVGHSAANTPMPVTTETKSPAISNSNKTTSHTSKLEGIVQTKPYVNESDGLGVCGSQDHLVREVILLDVLSHSSRSRTTKNTRHQGRQANDTATDISSEYRPESGHLRYHHRGDEDSVPFPGFELPPTPSALEIIEMERQQAERRELERQVQLGNVFDNASSKGIAASVISDDMSLVLPAEEGKSRISGSNASARHSFCRCSSYLRELSVTHTTCNTCGKIIRQGSEACSRESSYRKGRDNISRSSLGSMGSRARQKMLLDGRRGKITTVTDEDYMDLQSILHEDDDKYYSDDDTVSLSKSNSTEIRYRNAKPFPLVDPDIHKLVYLRALQAAQYQKKPLAVGTSRLRKPHVFSYFQLWPFAAKSSSTSASDVGLQQDETVLPKKGQIMKHIFGNVKMDEYYPAVKGDVKFKNSVINDSTPRSDSTKASPKLPDIPPRSERSSVGLKMMKQPS